MTDYTRRHPDVPPLPVEPIVPRARGQAARLDLPRAMALAESQLGKGDLAGMEATLHAILGTRPHHAPALHLLGIVAHRHGQTERAIDLIGQAIERGPTQALYHANRGEMCRQAGRLDEAIAEGTRAIELDPGTVAARSNVGIAYYDRGDFERAEQYQHEALAIDPKFAPALNNLGSIRRRQEQPEAAITLYREVLAFAPGYVEARNNLGAVLVELERFDEALAELGETIRQRAGYADAYCNLGLAHSGRDDVDAAAAAFARALELRPDYAEALLGLGRTLQEKNDLRGAEAAARRALALQPDNPATHCLLAGIEMELGLHDRASDRYAEALRHDPDYGAAHLGIGALLLELGRFDEAEVSIRRALANLSDPTAAWIALAHIRKVKQDDDTVTALETAAAGIDSMPFARAMGLHYALGKCFDDIGNYDAAFREFAAGCRLKRSTLSYDPSVMEHLVDRLTELFDPGRIAQLRGVGDRSTVPVFVLGMARSGTTLTEQIIASHPRVHGAGELPDLLDLANRPHGPASPVAYADNVPGLSREDLARMGRQYVEGLRRRAPDALRITDKMPANFLCVGLIHLMLPNAKIVHVRRNPVDTCLSAYSRLFRRGQPHSYDLTELGRYYRAYARLMEHWRLVLPADALIEVQYEDLVENHEPEARRLVASCGLEWDDACLEFFRNDRSVRTASVVQVRQPLYRTSLERWRRYERHLGPLLEALGDLVPATS